MKKLPDASAILLVALLRSSKNASVAHAIVCFYKSQLRTWMKSGRESTRSRQSLHERVRGGAVSGAADVPYFLKNI